MENHFADAAGRWPAGRLDYCWQVQPRAGVAREQLAWPYRELTCRRGLVPVRGEWMHVTVARLAPVTGVTGEELAGITGLVREGCAGIAPSAVTAGRPEMRATGLACPLRPGHLLQRLRQVTTSAAREVTAGRYGTHPPADDRHLALAYAVAPVDDGPLEARISGCDAAEVVVAVTRLFLVARRHDCREITWQHIEEIPLTGSMP